MVYVVFLYFQLLLHSGITFLLFSRTCTASDVSRRDRLILQDDNKLRTELLPFLDLLPTFEILVADFWNFGSQMVLV